mmetsp:Transcript_38287/g.43879  ORF Transcript_38287/g.43879 Transcript_38287/m.43879 type:complete len:95 (+) Transcript_38287:142-426(+)
MFKSMKNPRTSFTSSSVPQISIDSYLKRLMHYIPTSPAILVIAMIYIDRVIHAFERKMRKKSGAHFPFLITSYNVHKLLLTAFLLAHKYANFER